MREGVKIAGVSIGVFVGSIVLIFVLGLVSLGYYKFFGPKTENIRREIFENTQSYIHGKSQDLAKYMEEYNKADEQNKEAIRQMIILRFAELDETKIQSPGLRSFLKRMRGY